MALAFWLGTLCIDPPVAINPIREPMSLPQFWLVKKVGLGNPKEKLGVALRKSELRLVFAVLRYV